MGVGWGWVGGTRYEWCKPARRGRGAKGRMSSRKALEDNKKSRPTPAMSSAGSSKDPAPSKRKNSDGVAAEVDGKTAKTPKEAVTEDDVNCEEPSGASGLLSFFGAKAL